MVVVLYKQEITNELDCRKYELERITIQHAKALLKKEILSNDPKKSKEHLKIGFKRLDKLWQLISHYVSFYESEVYYYDNFTEIGIFWNYMLLIIDEKSDYAFLLTVGAWD